MNQKLTLGRLMILGDSYSTFEGWIPEECATHYRPEGGPNSDVRDPSQTWWHQVVSHTNSELILNHSCSGTTICHTGYGGLDCSPKSFVGRFEKLAEKGFFADNRIDTLIVFGGTNDSWADSPIGTLRLSDWTKEDLFSVAPACCYLLHRIRQVLPDARVCFVMNCDLKPEITAAIQAACRAFRVDLLELTDYEKVDGHPNIKGMKAIAEQVLRHLMNAKD